MSATWSPYSVVAALVKAEDELGPKRVWETVADKQGAFIGRYFERLRDAAEIPEIQSAVARTADVVNRFLAERGFSIQLQSQPPPALYVASILDLLVEWPDVGKVTVVRTPAGSEFPAVKLTTGFQVFTARGRTHPVVCLDTKSGDKVFLTVASEPLSDLELYVEVEWLQGFLRPSFSEYGAVVFPMVDLDKEEDLSWLVGLNTVGDDCLPAIVRQALMQNKLKVNERGARAQSAVALGMLRCASLPKPTLVIDQPFYIWFERPGWSLPLFAGYITKVDWKNPGSLT